MQIWAALDDVDAASRALATDFDPGVLAVADTETLLMRLATIESRLYGVKARAAARLAESGRWLDAGARTPAEHLATKTGTGIGEARRLAATGEHLEALPAVRAAAVAGDVSAAALVLVADAAAAAPGEATRLLATAAETSLAGLREVCLQTKANADADPDATHRRIHDARAFRTWTDAEGAGHFAGHGVPEDIAWLRSVLEPARDDLFTAARRDGDHPPSDQLDYDALFAVLRSAAGEATDLPADLRREWPAPGRALAKVEPMPVQSTGVESAAVLPPGAATATGPDPRWNPNRRSRRQWSRANVIVRIDAAAAARGRAEGDERCEIVGTGPVPVASVLAMVAGGARLAVVAGGREPSGDETVETVAHVPANRAAGTDIRDPAAIAGELDRCGVRVSGLVHAGRAPNAFQLTALRWLNPTCATAGCVNPRCDVDHRTGWAITKTSRLEDLDPLCRYHHNLKTHRGWALVDGTGKRPLVPPEDERHPRHRRAG
ncbi:MAG: HNH endonuclease [Frankia sp.]|nr:HNH endonuclease [Frankia sp.]